eukprot:168931-Amphidinium_carterae.1
MGFPAFLVGEPKELSAPGLYVYFWRICVRGTNVIARVLKATALASNLPSDNKLSSQCTVWYQYSSNLGEGLNL